MLLIGNRIKKFIVDLLFPIKCLGCAKEEEWICNNCLEKIKTNTSFFCPICGLENNNGSVCHYCSSYLDGLFIVLEDNSFVRNIICKLKYNFILELMSCLDIRIGEYLNNNYFWRDYFVLVPVPLYRKKFLQRGFSQSLLISQVISKNKGNVIVEDVLKRTRYNHSQVGLGADKRRQNVLNNFIVQKSDLDFNRTIILIDDIYTTGATMGECARVLKKAGYKKVWGLVLLRG